MTTRRGIVAVFAGIMSSYTYRLKAQDAPSTSRPVLFQIEFPEGPVADFNRPKPGTVEKEERQRKEALRSLQYGLYGASYLTLKDPNDYESSPEGVALRVIYGKRTVELTAKEIMDALEGK